MAARDCRLLSDLLPDLLALIDQPATDPSQLAFPASEIARAGSNAQDELFQMAMALDADWTTKEAIIPVSQGATYVYAPEDCDSPRATSLWNTANSRKIRDLACGEWSQLGVRHYDALFKPKDTEHDNRATFRFMMPFPISGNIKLVYDYMPIRLAHGCLPIDGGGLSLQLADYEPMESDILNGLRIHIVADPNGTAAGLSRVTLDWDGPTRSATVAAPDAWNPIPKNGATYTSRPDIPRKWERLFVFEMAMQLGMKLPERIIKQWQNEREVLGIRAKQRGITIDRRAAKIVRVNTGAPPMIGGDPINGPIGY